MEKLGQHIKQLGQHIKQVGRRTQRGSRLTTPHLCEVSARHARGETFIVKLFLVEKGPSQSRTWCEMSRYWNI